MADWFKFYENFFDSPKFQYAIHAMSEVCPVTVLLLCEHCRLKSDTIPWTGDEVDLLGYSAKINITPAKVNESINLLVKIRMFELDKDAKTIKYLDWNKLQSDYCKKVERKARTVSGQCPDSIRTVSEHCPPRGEEIRVDKIRVESNGCPSLDEVLLMASKMGLAEWKAKDWFNEMEAGGWLDYAHRPIAKWQAALQRVKTKWEADGHPTGPPVNKGASTGNKPNWAEIKFRMELIDKEIKKITDNVSMTASGPLYNDIEKEKLKTLRQSRRELESQLKPLTP